MGVTDNGCSRSRARAGMAETARWLDGSEEQGSTSNKVANKQFGTDRGDYYGRSRVIFHELLTLILTSRIDNAGQLMLLYCRSDSTPCP